MVFNLFCDASIDINKKIACGGCFVTMQDNMNIISDISLNGYIQLNATNNSAEILAIYSGIEEALRLRQHYPGAIFRLFSDSKISLYGLRDWIKNWVANMRPDGVLISSSGKPVANQQRFIDIFNLVVENNLRIEFYHQIGHVDDGRASVERARVKFIRANKVAPEALGLDIGYICRCNTTIDRYTRDVVREYISTGHVPENILIEGTYPMEFDIRKGMLYQYIRCIDKTTVKSRHDFKGGFSQ